MKAINWVDVPENRDGRVVYTDHEMHVPGLKMFGRHHTQKALPALNPHYHKNCVEMTYLSKGSVHFWVDRKGYTISGGDIFMVNPSIVHDTEEQAMSLHSMYWFQLNVKDPAGFLYLAHEEAQSLIHTLLNLKTHVVRLDEKKAHSILSEVFQCLGSPAQSRRDMGAMLLLYFLHYMVNCAQSIRFTLQPDIGNAANYVLDHLDEELTIEQLAAVACLSVPRFKEKFKSQIGLPPREFINSEKIKAAEFLLQEGRSVMDTAMSLGFSSSNYFSVVFKRHLGCSPTEYVRRTQLTRLS